MLNETGQSTKMPLSRGLARIAGAGDRELQPEAPEPCRPLPPTFSTQGSRQQGIGIMSRRRQEPFTRIKVDHQLETRVRIADTLEALLAAGQVLVLAKNDDGDYSGSAGGQTPQCCLTTNHNQEAFR